MPDSVTNAVHDMYSQFFEKPDWATHVCIPASYIDPDFALAYLPLSPQKLVAKIGANVLLAYVFPLDGEDKQAHLRCILDGVRPELYDGSGDMNGLIVMPATVVLDGAPRLLPTILPERGKAYLDPEFLGISADADVREAMAWRSFKKFAERQSQITGLTLFLHLNGPRAASPVPDRQNEIHVFVGMAPIGEQAQRAVSRVCGMPIAKDGGIVDAHGPTPGRGRTFEDEQGEQAVQIVGNNWFLLAPLVSYIHAGSAALFEQLLVLAWQGWCIETAGMLERPEPFWTENAFKEGWSTLLADAPNKLRKEIEQVDRLLIEVRQEVAKLTRNRTQYMMCLEGIMTSRKMIDEAGRMNKDYRALCAMQELDCFWFDEDKALMVRTRWLACSHDGKRYAIGRYAIRIASNALVSVWCEEPARSNGEPHPHMLKHSGACFGNAGDAISQAAGEFRFADAIRYVIDWLTEGYSPDTTLVKIELWPLAADDGRPIPDSEPEAADPATETPEPSEMEEHADAAP